MVTLRRLRWLLIASLFAVASLFFFPSSPVTQAQGPSGATGDSSKTDAPVLGEVLQISAPGASSPFRGTAPRPPAFAGPAWGSESEPNDTAATADPISPLGGAIQGNLSLTDVDYYSFTAGAGDKVYAAVLTNASTAGNNSQMQIIASDGTTVLENDNDDGSIAATSSSIAGTVLPTAGTYYVRVVSQIGGDVITPYRVVVRVGTGGATAETESNGTPGTANPLPTNGWVSGVVTSTTDFDVFVFTANAGDTVYVSLDQDPERDGLNGNLTTGVGFTEQLPHL